MQNLPLRLPSPLRATLPTTAFLLPALIRVALRRSPPRASMSASAAAAADTTADAKAAAAAIAAAAASAAVSAAAASSAPDSAAANPAATGEEGGKESADVLVQYVVLRRDLADAWPVGSVVAQGCHAAVAAVWAHRDHPDTAAYCAPDNIDRMHKVTLEVKGETQLKNLAEKLQAAGVRHKLWIEQPENIPTCIATAPCPKSQVSSFFKKLKLCK